jgi:hypothetical protein
MAAMKPVGPALRLSPWMMPLNVSLVATQFHHLFSGRV